MRCHRKVAGRSKKMKINAYKNYENEIEVDIDTVLVSTWNAYLEAEGEDNKISFNDKEFFENSFGNAYDAAHAVAIGNWRWTDTFVFFDEDGYLVSFNHWDDENSPIDINIDSLIQSIKKQQKRYVVNNIPRAIHDALQEV